MTGVFIIFMVIILLLAVVLLIAGAVCRRRGLDEANEKFLNSEGDHTYYDRSLIEKKAYRRRHPDAGGVRTFGRLFSRHRDD